MPAFHSLHRPRRRPHFPPSEPLALRAVVGLDQSVPQRNGAPVPGVGPQEPAAVSQVNHARLASVRCEVSLTLHEGRQGQEGEVGPRHSCLASVVLRGWWLLGLHRLHRQFGVPLKDTFVPRCSQDTEGPPGQHHRRHVHSVRVHLHVQDAGGRGLQVGCHVAVSVAALRAS